MVQRDWPIGEWESPLKIRALRGGTVTEVVTFLEDAEGAYNALYSFNLNVFGWARARRFWRRFVLPDEPFGLLPFESGPSSHSELGERIIPEYRLELRRVSIQSPGFWEFFGGLNPLQQMREYLNDRHERRKDQEYRILAEKERMCLENEILRRQISKEDAGILRDQVSIMREAGMGITEIQQYVWSRLGQPLSQLGRHQDTKLIEASLNDDDHSLES